MIPVPIPDGLAEKVGGRRVVIGDPGDPTDVRPCELPWRLDVAQPEGGAT